MYRRRFAASALAGGLAASAGCVGDLLDDLTSYEASPATVSDAALEETGYEHERTEAVNETEEFAGEEVEVANHLSEYTRGIEVPGLGSVESGVFATIATPKVSVGGEDFNPVGDMDRDEIVDLVQEQYEDLTINDSEGVRTVETLDQSIEVETFGGTAALADAGEVDVLIDVSGPDHGDDHLVLVGVYPDLVPDEADRVTTLLEGLEHDG